MKRSPNHDGRTSSSPHRGTSHHSSQQQQQHHHQSNADSYKQQEQKLREDTTNTISKLAMEAMNAATKYTTHTTVPNGKDGKPQVVAIPKNQKQQLAWDEDDLIQVFSKMESTTDAMITTWKKYHEQTKLLSEEKARIHRQNDVPFREIYMEMMTKAFATELDDMRCGRTIDTGSGASSSGKGNGEKLPSILDQDNILMPDNDEDDGSQIKGGGIDVEVLIRSLQSGMDVWTDEERQLVIDEQFTQNRRSSADESSRGEGSLMTPHEHRRRLLFGNL